MPRDLERAIESDLSWVASRLGSAVTEMAPVSPLRGRDRPRAAFRLTLADGRRLKLRRLRSPERAEDLSRLLGRLRELGLPRVLLRREEALVVEWVDGVPLEEQPADADRIGEAAELLGRIHATPSFDGLRLPVTRSTRDELRAMQDELSILVRAGRLEAVTATRLARSARRCDPGRALQGIVHGDFCAENLVVDARGRIRVVDNEALQVGFLGLDLARVWSRWPLPEPTWQGFLSSYRRWGAGPADDEALLVWKLRILVKSAWYRVARRFPGADEALGRLHALLEAA
jgi:aminoglycoside phosphotransferase (APT) family kinase protein